MRNKLFLLLGITVAGALGVFARPTSLSLKKVAEYDLPGPAGKRFDYLTIDASDHYPPRQS
jgi:hypothetical protein